MSTTAKAENMYYVGEYEWGTIYANDRDPNAGGASHEYRIHLDNGEVQEIRFQHGPRNVEGSTRGILDEHLIQVLADRLRAFQAGPFAHPSDARALAHIEAASAALRERAAERRARGVLGKNEK